MNTQALIDSIVRQVTVLIAQLATAGGVRAPLAHLANQVFVQLARELHAQGVSRKVSADMFGLALRTYVRKFHRLEQSQTDSQSTLWQSVLDFIAGQKLVPRERILERFRNEDGAQLASVLHDLLQSGLVFATGNGQQAIYRSATADELGALSHLATNHGLEEFICVLVYREGPLTEAELAIKLSTTADSLRALVERLLHQGRIERSVDNALSARHFLMPLGQAAGWEAAVFDHFQAVVQTISQRLQQLSASADVSSSSYERGGSTYTFDMWPGHPMQDEVECQLKSLRSRLGELRERVHRHNDIAGVPASYQQVVLYLGQCVLERDQDRLQVNPRESHHESNP